jgi:hypothetical protein
LQFMQAAGAAGAGYASPAAGNTPGGCIVSCLLQALQPASECVVPFPW